MTKRNLMASSAVSKLDDLLIRADAEGEEEREEKREDKGGRKDASAGTQESTEIADAVRGCMDAVEKMADAMGKVMDRMDRQDARMDALGRRDGEEEEREDGEEDGERREDKGRKDAKRRDEGEESEGEDKPERVVADKKRRDGEATAPRPKPKDERDREEDRLKSEYYAKQRGDASEEGEGEEEAHADSVDMAHVVAGINELKAENARLKKNYEDLVRITPRPINDADSAALLDAQAYADSVYVEMGKRAPAPQVNEDLSAYRRRVAIDLKQHSPRLSKVDLWAVADDVAFKALEDQIYADAVATARSPANLGPLQLRGVKRSSGGHEITEYYGDSTGWMCELSIPATRGSVSVGELLKTGHAR